ncbi:periplasmic sensor signal transduction histidine kinase [Candidatus Koribacter versatilis Ellin345]|uniref:histidine kinase n=1 Tax=Koribacter versatilis (strain Ellin345) TaxID=204669 RepID=Q1IJV5_KORVE|nr:HAMP domain-containing sensor histidine kinase [Candidatus Koribacter versatilis]ABF42845.1 periplasmic sensor signal transduction histidine kinase [Candidatus Koribacter versatilis Ellin345]
MMKSLFGKIFLWFWLTSILLTVASVFIAVFLTGTPVLRQWASNFGDLYSRNVVQSYLLGGDAGLDQFLTSTEQAREIQTTLFGPDGERIRGGALTPFQQGLLEEARASGRTECRIRLAWQCAAVVDTPRGKFVVVGRALHPRRMVRQLPLSAVLTRAMLILLFASGLCFALARYIARPVEVLQHATRRIAAGDLSARAAPALAPRKDELVSLAEEFDVMAARIEALMQSQRQMLGDISHELRSPLTRLRVALELAEGGDAEAMKRMNADLQKLEQLIEQVLTLNRLDAGEKWVELQSTNLETVLSEVVRDANYEGRARNVSVELKAEPLTIKANPALLKSCVENIVRNALRYSPDNGRVEVEERAVSDSTGRVGHPQWVEIRVRDHGPGVPPEALPRLFEPFYRVAESRSEKSGGRGLGLSIAQRAAAVHGGTVEAKNREGGGLEVLVKLPVRS